MPVPMTAGAAIERLLGCLPESPERAAALVPELGGADALAAQARSFGLLPLLSHYLPEQFPSLREDQLAARFRSRQVERTTVEVTSLLASSGVSALVLKGAPLAARLYPESWLRPSVDVDLLVRPADIERAREVLVTTGWHLHLPQAKGPLEFGHDLSFVDARRFLLELHYRPSWHFQARFDVDALFARSRTQPLESGEVRALSAEDELVHLCTHAGAHFFEGVKWLFDLKLAAKSGGLDWPTVLERARQDRVACVTGLALSQARERVGAPIPAEVSRALSPGRTRRGAFALCRNIPEKLVRTRSFAFDLLLADGLSREWLLRLAAPPIHRVSRSASAISRLLFRRRSP